MKFEQSKKILISILVVVMILLALGHVMYIDDISRYKCEKRGGFWGGSGMCYPIKGSALKRENILGLKINIPEKENWFAVLLNRDNENLSGFIEDSKTREKTEGEVVFFAGKMKNVSSGFEFIAPFDVHYENGEKYSYLGLFSFSKKNREKGYRFYETTLHLDSFLIGQDIEWGQNSVSESGWYDDLEYGASFNFVEQEYFKEGEKKNVVINVYNDYPYFSLHKDCEDIVMKSRGDGKEYGVCVWENGNQCDLSRYERRMCPREGYDVSDLTSEAKIYAVINGANFYEDNTFYVSQEHNHCVVDDYFNGKCD